MAKAAMTTIGMCSALWAMIGCQFFTDESSGERSQSMTDTKFVVDCARKTCGITDASATEATAVTSPGKLLPFVAPEKSVWRVHFKGVKFSRTGSEAPKVSSHVKSLDVFISSTTGQVIAAISDWPEKVAGTRFPSIEDQERQMKRIGQTFTGLPNAAPKLSLVDAFQHADGVSQAKQIIVYYVMEAYAKQKVGPRPVWVIHAWGIPPFLPIGGTADDVPEDARNHLRTIVNASNGKSYGSDTIPQPR